MNKETIKEITKKVAKSLIYEESQDGYGKPEPASIGSISLWSDSDYYIKASKHLITRLEINEDYSIELGDYTVSISYHYDHIDIERIFKAK